MTAPGVPKLMEMLPPSELALIASHATRRKYRDGEIIHERGDLRPAAGIVITGKIKLTYPRSDGKEVFSGLIHTGQNYGDAALHRGDPRAHRAIAIGETVIDHLDQHAFDQLLEHPAIARALYQVATFRLCVSLDLLDDMRLLKPEVRLAKLFMRMHHANGGCPRIEFLQEDFAGMLGVSSVTLAKSLRQLERSGLIEAGYRHIRLTDPERLAAWIEREAGD